MPGDHCHVLVFVAGHQREHVVATGGKVTTGQRLRGRFGYTTRKVASLTSTWIAWLSGVQSAAEPGASQSGSQQSCILFAEPEDSEQRQVTQLPGTCHPCCRHASAPL